MELFVELCIANFLHTQLIQECNFQVQKVPYCLCCSSVVVFLGLLELRKDVSKDVFVHRSRFVMTILLIHKTGVRQKYILQQKDRSSFVFGHVLPDMLCVSVLV